MIKRSGSMNPSMLKMSLGISLGILCCACDRNENADAINTPPSQEESGSLAGDAFAKELMALKAQNPGQRISDEAITALLSKYKLPNPLLAVPMEQQPDPVLEEAKALGKTAGSTYIPVRKANFDLNFTMYRGFTVQSGAKLEAWTTRSADNQNVDPLLVAFYRTGGNEIGSAISIVGMDDDDEEGGLDPYISWVNNTGAAKGIEIVAYAYSAGTSGMGTLKIKTNMTRSYNGRIGGVYQYARNATSTKPLDGCTYNSDVLILTRNARDAEAGYFIGINFEHARGAILTGDYDLGGSDQTSVTLPVSLGTGWPDRVLAFNAWTGGSIFNASPYTAIQHQKYSCP